MSLRHLHRKTLGINLETDMNQFSHIFDTPNRVLVQLFNHNHSPRGKPEGGQFTSADYPELNAAGKPIKNAHGNYTPKLDKKGNRIPKPPGEVIVSSSHDHAHNSGANQGAIGSSRKPGYAGEVSRMVDKVSALSTDKGVTRIHHLAVQDQSSNLKNSKKKGSIYLTVGEKSKSRSGPLDVSTDKCPSEAEAMACLVGQNARRSVKIFSSNTKGSGASSDQPDKNVYAKVKKGKKYPDVESLQKALDTHFKDSDVKPAVGLLPGKKGFGVMYAMPNTSNDGGTGKARAGMARVASFNQDNNSELSEHPKHWNGVEKKLSVRDQSKRLNQFAKTYPDHPLSKEWSNKVKSTITNGRPVPRKKPRETTKA